jgi:hypothetical protein
VLGLPEDRRHERIVPRDPNSTITTPEGRTIKVRITDVSLSGAGLQTTERLPVGTAILLGRLRARVVRHLENGLAVEFATIQDPDHLEAHLR